MRRWRGWLLAIGERPGGGVAGVERGFGEFNGFGGGLRRIWEGTDWVDGGVGGQRGLEMLLGGRRRGRVTALLRPDSTLNVRSQICPLAGILALLQQF